ncbi:hypothetical protein [Hominifimenecus sp. rT4P-3]|uniref:hypothetical protein n=1 Tax=Hominifimenecus sp. rT4P-3 TaxID=3242979 RepID=UPI003DA50814
MPYWEVLGRTAVTQGTLETADKITQFLTYSGVDAAISFDEERSVYIVSVPQKQAELAEKLIHHYEEMKQTPEREAESAPPESFLSRSPVFVQAEDRCKNTTHSAYAFLTAGSFVFLLALIRCVMVFLKYRQDSTEACLLDLGMGTVFMSFGVYTLHKANELREKIKEENEFLTEAIEWFVSTYSASQLDETIQAAFEVKAWLPYEENYFLRRSLIRSYIVREYDKIDPSCADYLTDEIYVSIFEKPKLGQKPDRAKEAPVPPRSLLRNRKMAKS